MFKKLRRKFMIASVCSVFLVLSVILGIINGSNYITVVKEADRLVAFLLEGEGEFGVPPYPGGSLYPEIPYTTRYFTVLMAGDGTVLSVNADRVSAIDSLQAASYASGLFEQGAQKGFLGPYRYAAQLLETGRTLYVFVDCTMQLQNVQNFLYASIGVGAAGLAVVCLLIFLVSGRVMKPVAESYEKQKRFITDASHEIKTPLTIIGANTEILELGRGENEWTQGIREQVRRLSALTEKLVFLARMGEGTRVLMCDFSVSDAVRECVQSFAPVAAAKGIALQSDIAPSCTLHGNEELIRQLTSLLLDNALKYTDGTEVSVGLSAHGGKIRLTVKNPASFLPDGSLQMLFERFRRGDPSRNSGTGGHGIGLSVAQAIVEAHGGRISASCEGGMVTFSAVLPG